MITITQDNFEIALRQIWNEAAWFGGSDAWAEATQDYVAIQMLFASGSEERILLQWLVDSAHAMRLSSLPIENSDYDKIVFLRPQANGVT